MLLEPQLPVVEGVLQGETELVLVLQGDQLGLHLHRGHRVASRPLANLHPTVGVARKAELVPDPAGDLLHAVPLHLEVILQTDRGHCNPHGSGVGREPAPGRS